MKAVTNETIVELRQMVELVDHQHQKLCEDKPIDAADFLRELAGFFMRLTSRVLFAVEAQRDLAHRVEVVYKGYREAMHNRCYRNHCHQRKVAENGGS